MNRFHSIELIRLLGSELNLTFQIRFVGDDEYGTVKNGKWDGLVGELLDNVADIAVGPLTITYNREKVVYFTKVNSKLPTLKNDLI